MKPGTVKAIIRKEFYHLMRDFRSLYLAFALPLLLILLFGYALSMDVDNVRTIVMDHDRTTLSRDLIRKLDASSYFNIVAHSSDSGMINHYLDHGWATMAVIIPPDWTEQIKADREASLQVLFDGSDPNYAGISVGYFRNFMAAYNKNLLSDYIERNGMEALKAPVEGRVRVWFNEALESRNFIVPGIIAIIIMIVGAMLTSLVIAREYENGTMETLLSLPISAGEFIAGKAFPYFFIGLADVFVAVLMGQLLFGIVMKSSFWLLLLASSLYLLVALGLGLLISAVTKSQLTANQLALLTTYLPSLLLSDFVFPVINMPKVLQFVTFLVPARYFIDILNGLYLRNVGLDFLWPSYLVLTLMFMFLIALNCIVMKKEGL